jgi:hypothetical protein
MFGTHDQKVMVTGALVGAAVAGALVGAAVAGALVGCTGAGVEVGVAAGPQAANAMAINARKINTFFIFFSFSDKTVFPGESAQGK